MDECEKMKPIRAIIMIMDNTNFYASLFDFSLAYISPTLTSSMNKHYICLNQTGNVINFRQNRDIFKFF
jgi:hypothetical protein